MPMLENLTTLDVFLIICSISVAVISIYVILILIKVNKSLRTANMVTDAVDHFQGVFQIVRKVPVDKMNAVVNRFVK